MASQQIERKAMKIGKLNHDKENVRDEKKKKKKKKCNVRHRSLIIRGNNYVPNASEMPQ